MPDVQYMPGREDSSRSYVELIIFILYIKINKGTF